MPKLNRYNDGGFVYGQWREVGRRVDPVTGDIIITERRDGSKDVRYDTRGVSWRKGYEDWLAAGNEGTMDDFKLEAEAWKRSQDRKEFDSQNRERRIKRNQEGEGDDEGKPSDDPRPDDFVGDGPGVGGPGGGGSGDVSRPAKDDNVSRPRRPDGGDAPDVSILPKLPLVELESDMYMPLIPGMTLSDEEVDRLIAEGVLPRTLPAMTPEQMGEITIESGEGVGEVLPDSRVESEYNLRTDSRTNRRGKEIVKQTYTDNINLLRDDGLSTINTKQVDRSKTGRPTRSRGRSVYQEFDSEGNRIFRDVNRFESGGLVSKNNNHTDMYYNKKQMGMGGKNMPRLMKIGGVSDPVRRRTLADPPSAVEEELFPFLDKFESAEVIEDRSAREKQRLSDFSDALEFDLALAHAGKYKDAVPSTLAGVKMAQEREMLRDQYGLAGFDERSLSPEMRDLARKVLRGRTPAGTDASQRRQVLTIANNAVGKDFAKAAGDPDAMKGMLNLIYYAAQNPDSDLADYFQRAKNFYDEKDRKNLVGPVNQTSQKVGGKVKLMKKGGTVDYFAGGMIAAGAGQLAQRSNNPLIQGIGKVASAVGGMTPGGKAVNMAANFLPSGNPMAALGQLMRGR